MLILGSKGLTVKLVGKLVLLEVNNLPYFQIVK